MSAHPTTRDLDLWLIDKDAEGVIKPGPGSCTTAPGSASSSWMNAVETSPSLTSAARSRRGLAKAHDSPPR